MEEINVKNIIAYLNERVKSKETLDAHQWVDTAQKLNVLVGEEHDRLFELEQLVAKNKVGYIEAGKSATEAKMRVEATDIYRDMLKQKAIIGQVEELIRISKLQARLKDNEFHNY